MILKVTKSTNIVSLKDFVVKYNALNWVNDNIHLYEEYLDQNEMITAMMRDYFSKKPINVVIMHNNSSWVIIEISIPYSVVTVTKTIPCNSKEDALLIWRYKAIKELMKKDGLKDYEESRLDYDTIKRLLTLNNIKLEIIGPNI